MTRRNPIYIGNDNLFIVRGLRNKATNEYVNDGTATLTLLDADDNEIAGQTWPLSLTYIAASNGDYQGTIEDDIDVEDGATGTAVIAITGDSLTAELRLPVIFGERGEPALAWSSRREIELMFGVENVKQWADLDNDQDADEILERIDWAIEAATEDARGRLIGSPVIVSGLTEAPIPLRIATTRLAGVFLYESRGVKDTAEEDGKHRLKYHQDRAEEFFRKVLAGVLRLTSAGATNVPGVIADTAADDVIHSPDDPLYYEDSICSADIDLGSI